jgi:hypothetical protein
VELDDDPSVRLLGNLVGSSSSSDDDARLLTVDIGLPVVAVFESDPPLLQWRPLPE